MALFVKEKFDQGGWAGELATLLRQRRVLTDKKIVSRIWRKNWKQWVQCEHTGSLGPAFWFCKPAVISWQDRLYCECYFERGYSEESRPEFFRLKPEYIMDSGWHWHLLFETLRTHRSKARLTQLMEQLPGERRCIWVLFGERDSQLIPFDDDSAFDRMEAAISSRDQSNWIDLILGVSFSADECIAMQQQIIDELRSPLIRAREIEDLVLAQRPNL